MALIDYVYNDVSLQNQFDDATDVLIAQAVNGSSGTGVFYIGTPTSGNKLQLAASEGTPGVDGITVSIVDGAGGVLGTDIKIASTEPGLAGATGGAAVDVAVEIPFGSPQSVWFQWDNSTGNDTYTDISLQISPMQEVVI